MKEFMDDNFLLQTQTAYKLYYEHSAKMPIIDYHCHLSPKDIAEDRQFDNITQIWLSGDHYKWRAMRANGVDEHYCTGSATDYEKFEKWAYTVPYTLRNPLYHWTHLELKRFFDIDKLLSPQTARDIWDECNAKLNTPEYSVRNLLRKANVHTLCTTDDPIDSLVYHQQLQNSNFEINVLPAWRPDKSMDVENVEEYNNYLNKLGKVAGIEITSFNSLIEALNIRHRFFHEKGCRLSDHGLETFLAADYTDKEINDIFKKIRDGVLLERDEKLKFKSCMLYHFSLMDFSRGWVQQYHIGALRNNNSRLYNELGSDIGCDSIGDFNIARPMSKYFDKLDSEKKLAKTIIYNLNPRDNELIATMIGNFQDGKIPGKIQFGSGWWFLDQKDGMEKQINALSNLGLLSRFVGMLTDSRSFLSYPRHEYFRRTLCNLIGIDIENGLLPNDLKFIGEMVENISFYNAKSYFNF